MGMGERDWTQGTSFDGKLILLQTDGERKKYLTQRWKGGNNDDEGGLRTTKQLRFIGINFYLKLIKFIPLTKKFCAFFNFQSFFSSLFFSLVLRHNYFLNGIWSRSDGKLMDFFRREPFTKPLWIFSWAEDKSSSLKTQKLNFNYKISSYLWTHFALVLPSTSICQTRWHFSGVDWLWDNEQRWWLSVQVSWRIAVGSCS